MIATGDGEGRIIIWNAASGRKLQTLLSHHGGVNHLIFSPQGRWLLSSDSEGFALLHDTTTWLVAKEFDRQDSLSCCSIAISPDDATLLIGDGEADAVLYNAATGTPLHSLRLPVRHGRVSSAAFSGNGDWVLTGYQSGLVTLWDARNGLDILTFFGNESEVRYVSFIPDSGLILTTDQAKTIKLWDMATGRCLVTAAISADGGWLAIDARKQR